MNRLALADLRLDLRDIAGVVFVATSGLAEALRIQVVVDDPSVVPLVERTVDELTRRLGEGPVEVEVSVAGARRSELALRQELSDLDGVRSVELERGPRGELLRARVTTSSADHRARVEALLDRRLGRDVRRRRVVVRVAGPQG